AAPATIHMGSSGVARGQIRDLILFVIAFVAVWTVDVVVAWRLEMVPETLRPWLRTVLWIGAAAVWIAWQRTSGPVRWLGLAPVSRAQAACALIAFASIFCGNLLRVHLVGSTTHQLAAMTPAALAWTFVAVFVEELVFRGVVQTRLAEQYSAPVAIL